MKFCIDRFKHNTTPLKFYTGFESFDTFKAVLDYLNPAANSLAYWGSNINIEKIVSPDFIKRGSKRIMTVEEFFLTLVRLRCALPTEDLTVPFNLSSSSISRILINGEPQLSLSSENETRQIASVRAHVGRAIERIKNFKILQSTFLLSMAPELNKIWVICDCLVNFLPQLVPDKKTG